MINLDVENETPEELLQKSLQSLSESGNYQKVIAEAKKKVSKMKEEANEIKKFPIGFTPSVSDLAKIQAWTDATKQLATILRNKCECQLKIARLKCGMSSNYLDLAMEFERRFLRTDPTITTIASQQYLSMSFAIIARSDEINKAFRTLDIDFCLNSQEEITARCNQSKNERVYFLLSKKCRTLKIGYSSRLSNRIKALQASSPEDLTLLKSIPGSKQLEAELHKKFCASRLHGEWFSATPEIMEYIKSL